MAVAMPLPARGSEGFNFREQQGWIRTTQNKEARFCQKTWSRHNHVLAYEKKKKKRFQTNFAQSPTLMSIQIILKHKHCPDASPGSPTCPTRRKQLCKAQGYLNNLKTWKITFFQKPPNSKPRFSWNSITKTQHEANILFLLVFCPHWKSMPLSIFTQTRSSMFVSFVNLSTTEFSHQISEEFVSIVCHPEHAIRNKPSYAPLPDCKHLTSYRKKTPNIYTMLLISAFFLSNTHPSWLWMACYQEKRESLPWL